VPAAPLAIVDIGSNSVRLVVYSGLSRSPSILFNEKVMAGLGKSLTDGGMLSPAARDRALAALRRYRILTRQMGVERCRVVATAAVRDASNCAEFLDEVRSVGFEPQVLSGDQEGRMAGHGVLSGIPHADGIAGDLGGGSLELADVAGGEIRATASLPLGVLRLGAIVDQGPSALGKRVSKALRATGFRPLGRGRPFYMVGGSWRALARLDMVAEDYPLPILHQYQMAPDRPAALQQMLETLSKADLKSVPSLSQPRVPTLPNANLLLKALVDELKPSALIVSSFGIREGLLHAELDPATRALDPLISAVREAGGALGRFGEHGALLDRWIAPIFDDSPAQARLRLAACLLADVGWQAHPDYRAERGVDMALHGNWVGIDGPGRVMLAQALFASFGGARDFEASEIAALCSEAELDRAVLWGLAIRLGQRLSGGVAATLERSRLACTSRKLRLEMKRDDEALYGETVARRHKMLATALGLETELRFH
jgi:exopolyphosphatase/guanosine-5'-triphosphate,3'-diphosphate pyrophosphatase